MKTKLYVSALLFLFSLSYSSAQSYGSMGLNLALPQNEFKQQGYGAGGGIGFNYYSNSIPKLSGKVATRLFVGFDVTSTKNRRIKDALLPSTNDRYGEVYFSNTTLNFSLGPQFSVQLGKRFIPYASIFGSARVFHSSQSYYDANSYYYCNDYFYTNPNNSKNIFSAVRFQYGYAGGLMYKVANNAYIDARVSYARGNGTTFINIDNVSKDADGNTSYTTKKSATSDMLTAYLGVGFSF